MRPKLLTCCLKKKDDSVSNGSVFVFKDVTISSTDCPVCFPEAGRPSGSGVTGDETEITDETNFFSCRGAPPRALCFCVSLLVLSAAPHGASLCSSLAQSSSFLKY